MRNILTVAAAAALISLAPSLAYSETDWVVDILPGTILANFAADGFEIYGSDGEESLSMISSVPSAALGIAVERTQGYIEAKVGGGMLLNSRLSSYMIYGIVGGSLEIKPSIFFGPHASLNYYTAPEWWGDEDVEFSDTTGFSFGMHMIAGDKISYLISLDYFSLVFDVDELGSGVTASHDELDMSGIAVQFGFRAQF